MVGKEEVLDVVVKAFEGATSVTVIDAKDAIIDDSNVSGAIRKTIQSELGVTLWPKDRETVQEYADRISAKLGVDDHEAPLDFSHT